MNWHHWLRPAELIGFLAFALNVWGNWALTDKRASGWWVRIGSNVAQLAYALVVFGPYLLTNAVVFGAINVRGIVKWKKEEGCRTT